MNYTDNKKKSTVFIVNFEEGALSSLSTRQLLLVPQYTRTQKDDNRYADNPSSQINELANIPLALSACGYLT